MVVKSRQVAATSNRRDGKPLAFLPRLILQIKFSWSSLLEVYRTSLDSYATNYIHANHIHTSYMIAARVVSLSREIFAMQLL